MTFSVIIPSFNQHHYIRETLRNLHQLKEAAAARNIFLQLILVDNNSAEPAASVIREYMPVLDKLIVEADKGQYDAINKGLAHVKGGYWTWLNTDDLLEEQGFFKMVEVLKNDPTIDYIYGGVNYINEKSEPIRYFPAYPLSRQRLVRKDPAVFQPGSFFRTGFTEKVGKLKAFRACFDYEYILRCFNAGAKIHYCEFPLSRFRYYRQSKTGSITPVFIREQLVISAMYGRKWHHFLTWFSYLRLLKHRLFPR